MDELAEFEIGMRPYKTLTPKYAYAGTSGCYDAKIERLY